VVLLIRQKLDPLELGWRSGQEIGLIEAGLLGRDFFNANSLAFARASSFTKEPWEYRRLELHGCQALSEDLRESRDALPCGWLGAGRVVKLRQ
jgi:hypothetical protein